MIAHLLALVLAAGDSTAAPTPADSAGGAHRPGAVADSVGRGSALGLPRPLKAPLVYYGPIDSLPYRLRDGGDAVVPSTGRGQLVEPSGVAADAFGTLHVADATLHRIQRFDPRGVWLGEAGTLGSGTGEMRHPSAVATLGTLSIAVLDDENRRVLSYDLLGKLQGTLIDLQAESLTDVVGRIDPVDLAADRGGAVLIADADRDRILIFDFSGQYLRTLGGFGSRPGSFRGLSGLAVGRRGEIVATERGNARVQRLDAGGRVLGAWSIPVRAARAPLPVAVDDSGHVAVADAATGRLWVYDGSGRLLAARSGLKSPRALSFARDGLLLVAEAGAGRVRRIALEPATQGRARSGE